MRFVPFLRGKTKKYYNLSVLYNVVMGEVVNNAGMSCSVRNGDYVDSDADLDAVIQDFRDAYKTLTQDNGLSSVWQDVLLQFCSYVLHHHACKSNQIDGVD